MTLPIDDLVEQPPSKNAPGKRGQPLCRRCLTVRAPCSRCFGLAHRRDFPRCRVCREPFAPEPKAQPWGFGHSNIADAEVEG